MKNNKGITLISLVITIILLLILATVAISLAIDSDGLFGKAGDAANKWNTAVNEEEQILANLLGKLEADEEPEIVEGDPNYWQTDETGTILTGYTGPEVAHMVIPNYVNGIAIEKIGENLFVNKTYMTSLTISEGIKEIGIGAFLKCTGLTGDLRIPDSVETIGMAAFQMCTGLNGNLVIGDGVTTIEYGAFDDTKFTGSLILGKNVTTIGGIAFRTDTSEGATEGTFTGDLIIPNSITQITQSAFHGAGFTGKLEIPNSVTEIGNLAFAGCGLIGDLIIPNSVTTIGVYAFVECTKFNSITVPNTVETVEDGAFEGVKQVYYSGSLDTTNWGADNISSVE